jgi:hypothetical protein
LWHQYGFNTYYFLYHHAYLIILYHSKNILLQSATLMLHNWHRKAFKWFCYLCLLWWMCLSTLFEQKEKWRGADQKTCACGQDTWGHLRTWGPRKCATYCGYSAGAQGAAWQESNIVSFFNRCFIYCILFSTLTYLTFTQFSREAGRHRERTREKCYHCRFRTSGWGCWCCNAIFRVLSHI